MFGGHSSKDALRRNSKKVKDYWKAEPCLTGRAKGAIALGGKIVGLFKGGIIIRTIFIAFLFCFFFLIDFPISEFQKYKNVFWIILQKKIFNKHKI